MSGQESSAFARRRRVTAANVALFLGGVALVLSVAVPRLHRQTVAGRVETAVLDVTAVRDLALRFREEHGTFPDSRPAGERPPEFGTLRDGSPPFARPGYTLQWNRWNRVREPAVHEPVDPDADTLPSPPPTIEEFGGVTVFADDAPLLAALRERFGEISTVRARSWTLLVPPR